jgi:mannosylglycerate hydrolase
MAAPSDEASGPSEAIRRRVHVVPHTHWDREWYAPFQTFRLRLVELVDELLDLMESDPSYARFLFDGQMAAVDDYLEVRPENADRLRRLAAAGRLTVGPWYILMDEFLVSGETIVRNLELGFERAAEFGGAMEVGYLPDMFGHVAQMPQLLASAGFRHALVWRGVPSAIDRTAFWWRAPDGSTVRAEYLLTGYSAGASVADDAKAFVRRLSALEEDRSSFLGGPGTPILFPNGTDHQRPQPWLGRVVAEANGIQDRFEITISSLPEALAHAPVADLPEWRGELRSGARANVLMGVASNRVDVKQAAAAAERALERSAEPLASLLLGARRYPHALLRIAWRELIRNSAHDSICACSHDEVNAAVLHRYAEANRIAEGVRSRALGELSLGIAEQGHAIVNATARVRSGVVELLLSGEGTVEGAQVLAERVGQAAQLVLSTAEVRGILGQLDGHDQISEGAFVTGVDVDEDDSGIDIVVRIGPERREGLPIDAIKSDLLARMKLRPDASVRIKLDHASSRRILVRVEDVPGYGWKLWRPAPLSDPVGTAEDAEGAITLANSRVSVVVSPADGTFSVNGLQGFDRLVNSGDHGDTYNYSPPEHDSLVEHPDSVSLELEESGPVRAIAVVRRSYRWPERIDEGARARVGEREIAVTTRLELRAGEGLVRVGTSFDNACRDYRLRAWFPLPEPAEHSFAECAFGIAERGLVAEGGPSERGLATYPSRRFVHAGCLTVCHDGLCEYELVDLADGRAHGLTLTLLRATGMLSRLTTMYRPLPAGPTDVLEGPQLRGPVRFRYAVAVDGTAATGYELADEAFSELFVVPTFGGGELPSEASLLSVSGGEVSSLRRVASGGLELRVFNPSDSPVRVELRSGTIRDFGEPGPAGGGTSLCGDLVDLRGRFLESFEGGFRLGPFKIATARIGGR